MTHTATAQITGGPHATRPRDSPSRFRLRAIWFARSAPPPAPTQGWTSTAGRAVRPDQHT